MRRECLVCMWYSESDVLAAKEIEARRHGSLAHLNLHRLLHCPNNPGLALLMDSTGVLGSSRGF